MKNDLKLAQELVSMRTENGSVFAFGGNKYEGVTYAEPVHQINRHTGEWDEIDASFREDKDGKLIASAGALTVVCGASDKENFISIRDENNNEIAWEIEEAATIFPEMGKLPERSKERTIRALRERPFERLHHQLFYREIFPGVDMVCTSGTVFNEEFVFSRRDAARPIRFHLRASGRLCEDKQGVVMQDAKGEIVFRIRSPFLIDANGDIGKVVVSLRDDTLTYEPDPVFMAGAVYPIVLDPTVRTSSESTSIVNTYVKEGSTNDFSGSQVLWITNNNSGYGNRNSYIKVNTLPSIGSNHFITEAYLHVKHPYAPGSDNLLLAKEVESAWSPSGITYATQPQLNSFYQDSWVVPASNINWREVDVTALAKKWYAGINYGVAFVPRDSGNAHIRLNSISATSNSPYFSVDYSSLGGLEDYLSYDAQSVGRAGTGYVSLHNGNMIFAHGDTIMNGLRMPVSITHYYNSCDADKNDYYMGKGWKTNLHQTLHKELLNNTVYYVYTDGDGTEHFFESANTGNTEYKDMSGLELVLVPGVSNNPTTITDKRNTVMSFPTISTVPTAFLPKTSSVLISSITDANGNVVTIYSEGLKINSVSDGAGRITKFIYSSNLCSAIYTPWQTAATGTRFTYDSSANLIQVTYEDHTADHHKQTSFEYNTDDVIVYNTSFSLLTNVSSPEGFSAHYVYTSPAVYSGLPHYVKAVSVKGGTQLASRKEYTYGHLLTVAEDKISGKKLRFHFNENGNQISVDDQLGYARYTKYDDSGSDAPINHATERSRMQKVVTNLLMDGMLNDNSTLWTTGGQGSFELDSSTKQWGAYSQKITVNSGYTAYKRQAVSLTAGKSYTLSGFIKSDAPKAFLRITYTVSGVPHNVDSDPVTVGGSGFDRTAVSFTLPSNAATTVYCAMVCMTTAGNAWFDCIQLEEGLTLNHFNMLQNSNFIHTSGNMPVSWVSGYNSLFTFASYVDLPSSVSSFLTGRALHVTSLYYATIDVYQKIRCIGQMGDRFSAGGWCSSYAKRNRSNNPCGCRINVLFGQSENTSYWVSGGKIEWNSTEGEWQFASTSVVAPMDYNYIKFTVEYSQQINHADFSNLFLYPEQFGAVYAYDSKGNSTAVTTLFGKSSGAQYDTFNNMTSYTAPGHSIASTFDYGSTDAEKKKHLLLKSISPMGTVTANSYNSYGNPTQTQVKDADTTTATFIRSDTSYTTNGNYVYTQTDARAKTVTTVTDTNKGTVSRVTDPNSQIVDYTYDTLRRVKTTKANAGGMTYLNTYTYNADKDWLTQVKHNTTSDAASSSTDVEYNFTYDAQGRQTKVEVGTQTLCENEYDTNVNHYGALKKVTYGNGQTVENDYDDFCRVTGVRFNGETTPRYKYSYNANGQVANVVDSDLGRVQQSEYDLSNRPCRVKLHEDGNHVYTGEVEYDGARGNLAKFTEKVGPGFTKYETTFGYDNEDRPVTLSYGDTSNQTILTYDGLGRVSGRTVKLNNNSFSATIGYTGGGYGTNSTTSLIRHIFHGNENFVYYYDDVGNISYMYRTGKYTGYVYDGLGQLIRVNDQTDPSSDPSGTTWTYEYDRGGNIQKKKRYAYTTGTLGTPDETIEYGYGDGNWKDKMTHYNYNGINYDNIGNPVSYDSWTFTWEKGRQLKQMADGIRTLAYSYNADGLRVKKRYTTTYGSDVTTNYIFHGKNIVHMTQGTDTLHFWYDAQGRPAIVDYNGTKYAYLHNLQGDIIGIIDSNGNEVVQYSYDAWGKVVSVAGIMSDTLGILQPFRYRGYVYDVETGLYYLRSRYYNPEWGRFINSDSLTCNNLFAYCHNTPSIYSDANGYADRFAGEDFTITDDDSLRDNMVHVLNKDSDELMNMTDFFELLSDMRGWEYAKNACYYGKIDCVGVYRFPMYWYYSNTAYESLGANGTTVEYLYDHALYEENSGEVIKKKGLITDSTVFIKGMALIRYGEKKNKTTGKIVKTYLHVAIYVGDYFPGIKNGVIEAVESGVVVRKLEESEKINGAFTHCGFFKGLSYIWLD